MASNRPQNPYRVERRKRKGRPTYASAATRLGKATRGKQRWHLGKVRGVGSESCGFEKRRFCRDEKGRFKKGAKGCGKLKYEDVAVCRGIWGRFEGLGGLGATARPWRHQNSRKRCQEWTQEVVGRRMKKAGAYKVNAYYRGMMGDLFDLCQQRMATKKPFFRPARG